MLIRSTCSVVELPYLALEKLLAQCEHVVPRLWVRKMEGEDRRDSVDSLPVMIRDEKKESRKAKKTILLRWHPAFVELLERLNGQ